ncbi:hypothetical protein [Deinococcus hopiensis]|uniref:hypothetical protein n=1 Tax=Deinococcus hopiensis TaxID=309885 RepID=UPI0009FE7730|nr:hypothetical protein [Deinococcus hopiensis]
MLALTLMLGAVSAQSIPRTSSSQTAREYVQQVHDMTGLPVTVKHVACVSSGKPDTLAEVYLTEQRGLYRVGRMELNEKAKQVLDEGRKFPTTQNYYNRYVVRGESFSGLSLNALLGFWRLLGMRFKLDDGEYVCRVS